FFQMGLNHRERLFLGGNRTGKTVVGGFETTLHLTGRYPDWWEGRRFSEPGDWWAAGDTRQTTRDIQQKELLGPPDAIGTGLIPEDAIIKPRPMSGVPDAFETVTVRHVSGGVSTLGFKSYDQGRKSFQGTAKQGIWLDEECPMEVYVEALMRTMTTGGLMLLTFTPLNGLTQLVLDFLPKGNMPESGLLEAA
ncbi:MAG: terminase family protein, partial [Ectothiorhodospiraceae bacterium]|nr:terminase family protein [Ectothiorhodospiraceae bacterium]